MPSNIRPSIHPFVHTNKDFLSIHLPHPMPWTPSKALGTEQAQVQMPTAWPTARVHGVHGILVVRDDCLEESSRGKGHDSPYVLKDGLSDNFLSHP